MLKSNSGSKGESKAASFLVKKGYDIVAMNYLSRFGEIDIIAENEEYIVFVEVKTRIENPMVSGVDAVTIKKQRRIISTALEYLKNTGMEKQPRFDIIEVFTKSVLIYEKVTINHTENAFEMEDGSNAIF